MNKLPLIFYIVGSLFFLAGSVLSLYAQDAKHCDHLSDSDDRFDAVRILPPARITAFESNVVTWATRTRTGQLNIDKDTILDPEVLKDYRKGLWWLMYSLCDSHVYVIQRVTPEQIKRER